MVLDNILLDSLWLPISNVQRRFDHPYISFLFYGMDAAGDFIPIKQLREKYNRPRHEIPLNPEGDEGGGITGNKGWFSLVVFSMAFLARTAMKHVYGTLFMYSQTNVSFLSFFLVPLKGKLMPSNQYVDNHQVNLLLKSEIFRHFHWFFTLYSLYINLSKVSLILTVF